MKQFLKKIIVRILTWEARLVLMKYKPNIVAVTGNVGKTSAKDAIYTVLSHAYYVRKSEKSFNSELGVPLTILGCGSGWNNPALWLSNIAEGLALIFLKNHYPKWLVLEVGADRPGDIEAVARWLSPDIVVVTRIGEVPVHVEFFSSQEDVVREKGYLAKSVSKDGTLILNGDDANVLAMKTKSQVRVLTYGFGEGVLMSASNHQVLYAEDGTPSGINFKINYGSISMPVHIMGTIGYQHAYAVLAALLVGVSREINLVSAVEWLREYNTPPGRLKIVEGIRSTTILDDTYNASPTAAYAALEALREVKTRGRKIAVLGDMLELGKHTIEEHRKVGEKAAGTCDILFVVGMRAETVAESAEKAGMAREHIVRFSDSRAAGTALKEVLKEGDIVLVKGSQGMRMERIVREVMAHPEDAEKLLVRQEEEWLARA